MVRYETLILAHPSIEEDKIAFIEQHFNQLCTKFDGKVLSFDRWGKLSLSYPVKHQDYGVYILVRTEFSRLSGQHILEDLKQFFQMRCSDLILRYLHKRLEDEQSLEYQKPDAVVAHERYGEAGRGRESHGHGDHFGGETDALSEEQSL